MTTYASKSDPALFRVVERIHLSGIAVYAHGIKAWDLSEDEARRELDRLRTLAASSGNPDEYAVQSQSVPWQDIDEAF